MNTLFKIICCLALAAVAFLCKADAKEGKCRAIFGSPYKERSDFEDGIGAIIPFYRFYEFVLPYKIIHNGVVPQHYSYRTKEKSFLSSTDEDRINQKLKEWAEEKKKAVEGEAENCTCSQ